MIIRMKDAVKLLGVLIMCACAVLVCTMFLNANLDLARIESQIIGEEAQALYSITVSSSQMTSAITGGALALTTVAMLLFYIKHFIDAHKPELGVLKALGYSGWKIAGSFWKFGLSVFLGAAAGFALAFAFMPAFYQAQRSGGRLPEPPLHFNPILVLYLVVLPSFAFSVLAVLYAHRLLKRPPLQLIKGGSKPGKKRSAARGGHTNTPFLRALLISTLRSRISLVFFIWLSGFCFSATTVMAFSISEVGGSDMMAVMMAVIGIVLAVTTLLLAVTTVVRANGKTIAMLRVCGYTDRECAFAIFSGYRPATYLGFLLGSAYQHGLMLLMMGLFFDSDVLVLPDYTFNFTAFFVALAAFAVLYEGLLFMYAKRIRRLPLKEVMQEE